MIKDLLLGCEHQHALNDSLNKNILYFEVKIINIKIELKLIYYNISNKIYKIKYIINNKYFD